MVHGFLGAGRNLTTLARRLVAAEPGLVAVLVDLPGHGSSPPLEPGADIDTLGAALLETVKEVAAEAGAGPVPIIGHSLGGRAALAAARLDGSVFSSVTLLDIGPSRIEKMSRDSVNIVAALQSGPREAPTREAFRAHLATSGVEAGLVEWQLLNVAHDAATGMYRLKVDPDALAALHPRVNAADLWDVVEGPRRWRLHEVRGGRSPYVSDADAERLRGAGAAVDTLEGVGHFVHVEGLEGLLAAIAARGGLLS
jgi:pimeloyl-ACP methyl ester carboxylesterase